MCTFEGISREGVQRPRRLAAANVVTLGLVQIIHVLRTLSQRADRKLGSVSKDFRGTDPHPLHRLEETIR